MTLSKAEQDKIYRDIQEELKKLPPGKGETKKDGEKK